MHTRRRIVTLLGLLFASTVKAHPGHPAFSLEHTHRLYEFDIWLGLLAAALGVTIVWWRTLRRERRYARKS